MAFPYCELLCLICIVLGVDFLPNDQDDGHHRGLLYSAKVWLLQAGWDHEGVGQARGGL